MTKIDGARDLLAMMTMVITNDDVDGCGAGGKGGDVGDGGDGGTIWRVRLAHYKGGAGLLLISTINHNSMFTLCRPILPISASLCSVHEFANCECVYVFVHSCTSECLCILAHICFFTWTICSIQCGCALFERAHRLPSQCCAAISNEPRVGS